ncbi:MAG: nucleoside triphosphate pyrophosphohydrolase [Candidatus Saganbacteria bacterium]|nr:nucleoside triphosphate pyrophosphohydrolase [Candidatus Saganbacteria bacterium]
MGKTGKKFEELVKTIEIIRKKCPWDKKQNHKTLKPYMVEEVYEALEAIDSEKPHKIAEELGDMLLHIVMHATFAKEKATFTIDDVIEHIREKMIRRHPHVFGDKKKRNIKQIWAKWEKIKKAEGNYQRKSILDGVPAALPALLRADRIQKRAARVGFDWDQVAGAWNKVKEEMREIHEALKIDKGKNKAKLAKLKEEIGDLLFAVTNVSRKLGLDAEDALQKATDKFKRRFGEVEKHLKDKKLTLREMDRIWKEIKKNEK